MSRHTGPPPGGERPPVPEPSYAERARTLLHVARTGTLATLSARHPGHPFASVMPYALDDAGRPLFLISRLAMHTQNLERDSRSSLLVAQPGVTGDPLGAARVTVMGAARLVSPAELAETRAAYLARHENAAYWVDFDDFGFWRLDVVDVYFVGGFAAMDWLTTADYAAARPDPLADAADGVVEHMNRDHADAVLTYARVLGGEAADEATMLSVDRLGFRLRLRTGERWHAVRIAFPHEVTTPAMARTVFIDLLRQARAAS